MIWFSLLLRYINYKYFKSIDYDASDFYFRNMTISGLPLSAVTLHDGVTSIEKSKTMKILTKMFAV